jgi:hypothetical protein
MEAPAFNPPPPGGAPPSGPQYTPPDEQAKPFFDQEDAGEEETEAEQPREKKLSDNYQDKVIRGLIVIEDKLTASLAAIAAGQEDTTPFQSSDQDKDDLQELLEPFKDWIIDKVPHWLPLISAYGLVKTKQIMKARKAAKTNKANKAASNDPDTVNKVASAAARNGNRSNWLLYIDGYYRNDAKGKYINDRKNNADKLERPSIKDLDNILNVPSNRRRDLLAAAFGWSNADFAKHGITD